MRNILLSDVYRLKRQKSTWILPLATFVVMFLFGCIKGFLLGNAAWLKAFHETMLEGISAIETQTGVGSLNVFSSLLGSRYPDFATYVTSTFQRDSILFLIIFVSVYCAAVRRNGFSKNIASVFNSTRYNVSQALVLLCYSFILIAANLLAVMLSSVIFFEDMAFGGVGAFILYFVITAILHWAECLMVVLLCDRLRSPSAGVVIGCLYTGAVVSFVCEAVNIVLETVVGTAFRLNHIMPYGFSLIMRYDSASSYLYGVALSAIYVLIFFAGKYLIGRRDVV